jgi:L-seryl-tRNA(Ser) seleniumtransferase
MTSLRDLPSVEHLLQNAGRLIETYGRPLTLDALRTTLDETRARFKADSETSLPSTDRILAQAESHLSAWTAPTLRPVINATGVILHTNLGRAPLSKATIQAMNEAAANYTNLEYDLSAKVSAARGSSMLKPSCRSC